MEVSSVSPAMQSAPSGNSPVDNNSKIRALEQKLQQLAQEKDKASKANDEDKVKKLEEQIAEIKKQIAQLKQKELQKEDMSGVPEAPEESEILSRSRYFNETI